MSGLARLVSALARWVALSAAALGGVATLLCLVLVCWSVAARYLFGQPQPWIDKAAGWLVVGLVMLAAPEAQRRFEHIGVDVLTGRLRGRAAHAARLLATLSVALVAWILLQAGLETVEFSRMIGVMTEIEGVPVWWIQALLPLGAALLMLVALAQSLLLLLGETPEHMPDGAEELPRDTLARGE
ncbi:TRAP transporter small permease [Pseudoroseomonas cervicalis]|uniref:TRAP transporter small permease n=1 Tax=Teichococcus cervicalis TaxID=204525 RepID=UPI0022F18C90|nr:TRAP transporter small permease subunit [Pseudoroseomonas cervicalis]WBV43740.1 TRAP transporter small permease subunit [Pseudoroseomonas cervicalis]